MKSIRLIALLLFLPFSAFAGTFIETFDDENLDEWQEIVLLDFDAVPDTWEIIDGELQAALRSNLPRLLTTGDEKWRDYTVEVDVFPLERHGPGNIGIATRIQGTVGTLSLVGDSPFPFGPDDGPTTTCFGGDFHDNKFRLFGSGVSPLLELGTWSTLKLEANEDNFILWLNGEKVLTGKDETFTFLEGRVGLGVANHTVRFDNLVISGDGVPNKGRLSVTSREKLAITWGDLKRF